MKRLLAILLILVAFIGKAQDPSPLPNINVVKLIAPNNTVFYYNTLTHDFLVSMGQYGWKRLAGYSDIQGYGGGGSGSLTFLGLSDTPDSYAGQANKVVGVSGLETGVEFKPVTIDGTTGVINIPATATYNKGGVPIISQTVDGTTTTLTASQKAIKDYADTREPLLTKGNLAENITGLEFSSTRQVIGGSTTLTVSTGYVIPTTTNITHAESGYDNQITVIGVSGTTTKTITLTQQDSGTLSTNFNVSKSDVGLSNVDNTSDINKPISTAVQTALNGKESTLTKGNLTAGSNKVSIGGTGTNALIGTGASVDVNEGNMTLSNIGGSVTDAQVPNTIILDNITQITNRSHTNLTDIGTNTHAQIDTHITNDGDLSSTNELQTISTNGSAGNITLSNSGGTLNLNVNDADASSTNEIQDLSGSGATLSGYQISLSSDATPVTLPSEADGSTTNELQTISTIVS